VNVKTEKIAELYMSPYNNNHFTAINTGNLVLPGIAS